jgi:hypothetical protein
VQETNIPTLTDHLQEYLTRPDVVERMKPVQATFYEWLRPFNGFFMQIGTALQRVAEFPPSPGYKPWLIERRSNSIAARGIAHLTVRHGNRIAKESVRLTTVVRAIQFLAKPSRNRPAISRKAAILLAASEETSIIETIFDDAGLEEFEFIRLLKSVADGDRVAYYRLLEIVASLVPHLPAQQGRNVSAASAAHEFFLEHSVPSMMPNGPRAYSWNDEKGRFTDAMTEATRREFGLRSFDPRPAYRRLTARKRRN